MVHFRSALLPNWAFNMVSQRHNNSPRGISGTLLDDNNLSYNVQQSYGTKGKVMVVVQVSEAATVC